MSNNIKAFISMFGVILLLLGSCSKDYNEVPPLPPVPKVSVQTQTLEAWKASTPPDKISSSFWKTANYLLVSVNDVNKNLLYSDGLLNMTGTYGGLSSFNKGADPKLTLKAAYDNSNLYILAEWTDSTVDLSKASWLFDGNSDPLKATENSTGWTSQRNNDKIALAFEIASASSLAGTFADKGCQASCHGTGNSAIMSPTTGTVDLWSWNLGISSPLGYMHDMVATSTGLNSDAGTAFVTRNNSGSTDRSGPAYEWDGTPQTITLPNGTSATLDPAFYLKNKMPVIGSASSGKNIYYGAGDCGNSDCHGDQQYFDAKKYTGTSRDELKNKMSSVAEMANYWGSLSATDQDDVVAFIRGLAGIPGYVLSTPTPGSSNTDITAYNNLTVAQVNNAKYPGSNKHTRYQVLIVRKLNTNNADDIQFTASPNKTYNFGVALMNNDAKNHIGSVKEVLTFK